MGPRTCPSSLSRTGWTGERATDVRPPVVEQTPGHTHIYTEDARGVRVAECNTVRDKAMWVIEAIILCIGVHIPYIAVIHRFYAEEG